MPETATLKVTVWPGVTVCEAGGVVMAGGRTGTVTVSAAAEEVTELAVLVTVTV